MVIVYDIITVFLTVFAAYVSVILIIRASGKRTLSKLHAYDFVVTVCLGSIMASTIVLPNLSLYRGMAGFASLILMEYIISHLAMRFKSVRNVILAKLTILFYDGEFFEDEMWRERVTKEEVYESMRANGHEALDDVKAVVLEAEGSMSIVPYSEIKEEHQNSLTSIRDLNNE